jgi:hypothetical protein
MKLFKNLLLISSITIPLTITAYSCSKKPKPIEDVVLNDSSEEYLSLLYKNSDLSNSKDNPMSASLTELTKLINTINLNSELKDRTSQFYFFNKITNFYSEKSNKLNSFSYIGFDSEQKYSLITDIKLSVYDSSKKAIEISEISKASSFNISFVLEIKLTKDSKKASRNFNFNVSIKKVDDIAEHIKESLSKKTLSISDQAYNNIIQRIINTDSPTYSNDVVDILYDLNEVAYIDKEISNLKFDSLLSSSIIIDKNSWEHGTYSINPDNQEKITAKEEWTPVDYSFSSSDINNTYRYIKFDIKYLDDKYANFDYGNTIDSTWFESKSIYFYFDISISEQSKKDIISFISDNILKNKIVFQDNYKTEFYDKYNVQSPLSLFASNNKLDNINTKDWIKIETIIKQDNNIIQSLPENLPTSEIEFEHTITINNYSENLVTKLNTETSVARATFLQNISQYDHFDNLKEKEGLFISAETYNYLNELSKDLENDTNYSFNSNQNVRNFIKYINSDSSYDYSQIETPINNNNLGLFKSSIKKWPTVTLQELLDENNKSVDYEIKINFKRNHDFESHKRTYSNRQELSISFIYSKDTSEKIEKTIIIPYIISNYVKDSPESSYYALLDSYNWSDNDYKMTLNIQSNINDIKPVANVSNSENNIFGIMWTNFGVEYQNNNLNYLHPEVLKHSRDIFRWYGHFLTSNRDFVYKNNFDQTPGFYLENLIEPTPGSSYVIQGHNQYTDFFIASSFQLI